MCGIFATIGAGKQAPTAVVAGLKKLEYRGYDSWGVAFANAQGELGMFKQVGKISEFDEKQHSLPPAQIALGHTRWATHGGVKHENAHPHFDAAKTVAIAHNGIIENWQELKKELQGRGIKFVSQTDSEIVAHLIGENLRAGLEFSKAATKAVARLTGRFAVVAMCRGAREIFAARRGSPLIVGLGQGQFFVASDIPAFLNQTQDVNFLDDEQGVILRPGGPEFFNLKSGQPLAKRKIKIDWQAGEAEKGDFSHFMLKEIFEQKETLNRAIAQDEDEIMKVADQIKKAKGVFFVGAGTAGKVAHAGEYFFANVAKRHTNFAPASEFPLFEHFLLPETLILAISQSGETADVLEALETAEKAGSQIFSLVNTPGSSIARKSNKTIFIKAGPEKAVASTKAATSQLAILLLLAFATAGRLQDGKKLLIETASNVSEMLNPRFVDHVEQIAKRIFKQENLFIIGKGANFPMALESAIKIQEVSQVHAEGFAGGELKHGPIAMIENGTPCLVLVGDDQWAGEILQNAIELKARGARIIGIAPNENEVFDDFIRVPKAGPANPILNLIPVQLLAFFLGVLRGKNPDMPQNLAKSVTVK